jgi:glycosyltransferase involved in cell wall biosynthesis
MELENPKMINQRPRVSGLLPIRNGEKWLDSTLKDIASILNSDDELVIVNDGSTDGTSRILNDFRADFSIKIIETKGLGLVKALNLGLKNSINDWVARFDVDDTYLANRLEEQFRYLKPGVVAIFSDFEVVTPNGNSLGYIDSPVFSTAIFLWSVLKELPTLALFILKMPCSLPVLIWKRIFPAKTYHFGFAYRIWVILQAARIQLLSIVLDHHPLHSHDIVRQNLSQNSWLVISY